jgi:acyl-CoA thioesterase-2
VDRPPPVEIRIGESPRFLGGASSERPRQHWMRSPRRLERPPLLHAALLAHASDYLLLDLVLRARSQEASPHPLHAVRLDHSLWIH